jgi:hypothetical protein
LRVTAALRNLLIVTLVRKVLIVPHPLDRSIVTDRYETPEGAKADAAEPVKKNDSQYPPPKLMEILK